MADPNGRTFGLHNLNLGTAILLITMVAGLGGTWAVMGERIAASAEVSRGLRAEITGILMRLNALEREVAILADRELRRQSSRRIEPPQ